MPTISKLLVANRGEIAVRIMRAAHELGISTVAVASTADEASVHARMAGEVVIIGPGPVNRSYMNVDAVIEAALSSASDALHPGYGLLSENASFAKRVVSEGLTFVGPTPEAIGMMGDKIAAKAIANSAGVPVVPGPDREITDVEEAVAIADSIGYPVVLKASAGGGGRGIQIATDAQELRSQFERIRSEAFEAFGNAAVYVERYLASCRHIEVQIFGDGEHYVHLGERECSIQRRRQKLIEESPSVALPQPVREEMLAAAVALARAVGYLGAGTVEFLFDNATHAFYFIEMNTRIQVEHPVTEAVTGIDLVREQLLVASGRPLSFDQADVNGRGHAIEFRINAEDPAAAFMPQPGRIELLRLPEGPFVRVDTGYESGSVISPFYDSLLAKVIVSGRDRSEALTRSRRVLRELQVLGIETTRDLHLELLNDDAFIAGDIDTSYLERWLAAQRP